MLPKFRRTLAKALGRERGATAVEYALLAAFIASAIVAAVLALGQMVTGQFGLMNDGF